MDKKYKEYLALQDIVNIESGQIIVGLFHVFDDHELYLWILENLEYTSADFVDCDKDIIAIHRVDKGVYREVTL